MSRSPDPPKWQGKGVAFLCAHTIWITLAEVLRHAHSRHIWLAERSKADVISSGDWSVTIWAMVCSKNADSLCLYLLFGLKVVSQFSSFHYFPIFLHWQTLYIHYISRSYLTGFPRVSYRDARQIWMRLKESNGYLYWIQFSLADKLTNGVSSTPAHDLTKYRNHKIMESEFFKQGILIKSKTQLVMITYASFHNCCWLLEILRSPSLLLYGMVTWTS